MLRKVRGEGTAEGGEEDRGADPGTRALLLVQEAKKSCPGLRERSGLQPPHLRGLPFADRAAALHHPERPTLPPCPWKPSHSLGSWCFGEAGLALRSLPPRLILRVIKVGKGLPVMFCLFLPLSPFAEVPAVGLDLRQYALSHLSFPRAPFYR